MSNSRTLGRIQVLSYPFELLASHCHSIINHFPPTTEYYVSFFCTLSFTVQCQSHRLPSCCLYNVIRLARRDRWSLSVPRPLFCDYFSLPSSLLAKCPVYLIIKSFNYIKFNNKRDWVFLNYLKTWYQNKFTFQYEWNIILKDLRSYEQLQQFVSSQWNQWNHEINLLRIQLKSNIS